MTKVKINKSYYVYLLKCQDGYIYTGITNDLPRRLVEHQEGLLKRCFTLNRRPVTLIYYEQFNDPLSAICREKQIKRWSRAKKMALAKGEEDILRKLSRSHVSTSST